VTQMTKDNASWVDHITGGHTDPLKTQFANLQKVLESKIDEAKTGLTDEFNGQLADLQRDLELKDSNLEGQLTAQIDALTRQYNLRLEALESATGDNTN